MSSLVVGCVESCSLSQLSSLELDGHSSNTSSQTATKRSLFSSFRFRWVAIPALALLTDVICDELIPQFVVQNDICVRTKHVSRLAF